MLINRLEKDLISLLLSDSIDTERVNILIEEIGQKKSEQSKLAVNHLLESKDILTKEQRFHFMKKLMQDKRGNRDRHMGNGDRFKNKRRFENPQINDSLEN